MFTGIISDVGRIESVEERGDARVRIACGYDTGTIDIGASVACSGACLTVVDKGQGWFAVDVSTETRRRTAKNRWQQGTSLNLERALRVGDELGGHIVTGHVDAVGTIAAISPVGDSHDIRISAPRSIAPYLAAKGSVALDGVSLTVNAVEDRPDSVEFSFNLIPHSAANTTFGEARVGDEVNIEIDVLARYLGRMRDLQEQAK
jgi:riboflavin synthase